MPLEDYITPEEPLGPIRHEEIRNDIKSSALLTANVRPFERVFERRASMIIGRKGSGKTSVIHGYRAYAAYGRAYGRIDDDAARNSDLHINLVDWGHFHELVRNVANRASEEVAFAAPEDFIASERLAEIWTEAIWDLIFQTFQKQMARDPALRNELPSVVALFESEDVIFNGTRNTIQTVEDLHKKSIQEILNHFDSHKRRCFILIDSMDEYPIRNPLFSRVISGFLKCVNDFGRDYPGVSIIYCLPQELHQFVVKRSANLVKDFSKAATLDWRPSDLLRMVAERYRIGLVSLPGAIEDDYRRGLEKLDFESRDDLQSFFSEVLEHQVTNAFGEPEDALAYIIRHTQLLPREMLLLFNRAVRKSKEERGSWRFITANAVRSAIEQTETELARHILHPYNTVYPLLLQACDNVLPELPVVCTKSDLDRVGSRFNRRIEDDIVDPWRVLFDIGVIGYVEENPSGRVLEGERYVYGYFKFNSPSPIAFRNDALYCVHPLFSRLWSMSRSSEHRAKCVYPANIEHFRARG